MKPSQKPDVMDRLRIPMAAALLAASSSGHSEKKSDTLVSTEEQDAKNLENLTKQKAIQYKIYLSMYDESSQEEVVDNVLDLIAGQEFITFCDDLDQLQIPVTKNPINSKIFSLLSKFNAFPALMEFFSKLEDLKITNKEFYKELRSLLKQKSYNQL